MKNEIVIYDTMNMKKKLKWNEVLLLLHVSLREKIMKKIKVLKLGKGNGKYENERKAEIQKRNMKRGKKSRGNEKKKREKEEK